MTDLPPSRWNGTMLANLSSMGFDVFTLQRSVSQERLAALARNISAYEFGFHTNRVLWNKIRLPDSPIQADNRGAFPIMNSSEDWGAFSDDHNDYLLFLEEAVCSHANLGIVSTYKSTIGGMINGMRKANHGGWI